MKRLMCLILITVLMLAQVQCVFAYEYGINGVIVTTSATITDENDNVVTEIKAGDKIKATITVKPDSDGGEDVCLIIAASKDGRMDSVKVSSHTIYEEEKISTDYITVDGDVTDVSVYLWDGLSTSRPLMEKVSLGEDFVWDTVFEAEDYGSMTAMNIVSDTSASGGKYAVSASSTTQRDLSYDVVNLSYNIDVPVDDSYFVWARVRASSSKCYYYTNFDEGGLLNELKTADNLGDGEWVWCFVDKFYLYSGEHQLNVRYRTPQLQFDSFYITTDYSYTPEGAEPSIVSPYSIYERDADGNVTGDTYYNLPEYTPAEGQHPRLLFTAEDIPQIKANLEHEQNTDAYSLLLKQAAYETDGRMSEIAKGSKSNYDKSIGLAIEANAFLYQLEGDAEYGYKAIEMTKNYIESIMTSREDATTAERDGMYPVWVAAECYDWCYDLLTDEDKEFLIFYMMLQCSFLNVGLPATMHGLNDGHTEINGHNLEFPLLCGYFAAAIAIYDEAPDVYDVAAGRILQYIVPAVNEYNKSVMYTEGSSYGMYRHSFEIMNNYMFRAMGYDDVYDEDGLLALSYMYLRQPDGEKLNIGDDGTYYKNGYVYTQPNVYFYLGNMLGDSYLKTEYFRAMDSDTETTINQPGFLTPAVYLIMNDVDVECDRSFRDFPLTMFSGEDSGYMVARTSWDEGYDADTVVALMNLKTNYLKGHDHRDIGHFSLYYKGLLALDSGIYQGQSFVNSEGETVTNVGYGNEHHTNYTKQTVAHNTVLIMNPSEADTAGSSYGGQNSDLMNANTFTADALKTNKVTEILGYNWGPDLNTPVYSYMKGDLTDAYGDNAEEFIRSFMFFNFDDETYPAALIVFDNVRTADEAYTKKWLLHSEEEPETDENTVTIVRETDQYSGRLVNTTLMPVNGFEIEKIGGEGYEFYNNGVNYEMKPLSDTAEVGNWRIEITPKAEEKQSYFLNVIQVGDNDDSITPLEAKLVEETDTYVGVEIFNHIAYFRKDGRSDSQSFTINAGDSEEERFFAITGLAEGKWTVYDADGGIVAEEYAYKMQDSVSFTATGSEFTLKHTAVSGLVAPDYSVYANKRDTAKGVDVQINGIYSTLKNQWYDRNGAAYGPVEEMLDLMGVEYTKSVSGTKTLYTTAYNDTSDNYTVDVNGVIYASRATIKELIGGASLYYCSYDAVAGIVRYKHK